MDCNVFTAHCLSATLQYVGIRFRCFIHALQKKGEVSIRDKTDWYSNVQTEVVQFVLLYIPKYSDQVCRHCWRKYLQHVTEKGL